MTVDQVLWPVRVLLSEVVCAGVVLEVFMYGRSGRPSLRNLGLCRCAVPTALLDVGLLVPASTPVRPAFTQSRPRIPALWKSAIDNHLRAMRHATFGRVSVLA